MLYGQDLVSQQAQGNGSMFNPANIDELIKAMTAGQISGRSLDGQLTGGSALKYESLEATLKVLTFGNEHFTLYNSLTKKPAQSTVEEYNQMVDRGRSGKYSTLEGELPESSDSNYRRLSELIKYKGIVGQVTDVLMQTNNQIDVYSQEVQNKMTLLLQNVENELMFGDSNVDPLQFDGLNRLHRKRLGGTNEDYFKSPFSLDVRGSVLLDSHYNEVISNIVNFGYGFVDSIYAPPSVFTDYVDQKYDQRRIITGADVSAGVFGQRVTELVSQFGSLKPMPVIFGRRSEPRYTAGDSAAAQAAKSPATPTAGVAPAPVTDTTNKFGTAYAGDYYFAVAATNGYGESAMVALDAGLISVTSAQSVDLTFTITNNSYPATGYVIYRSEVDPLTALAETPLYPVFSISVAELTAGYDGAAAGKVRDKNYNIPNTEQAFLFQRTNPDIVAIKELGKMKKMDLAITSPTKRFAILYYLTQVLYAPKKLGVINNIGKKTA